MSAGMPRHLLLRLAALDLVTAALDSVVSPVQRCEDDAMRDRAVIVCARIGQYREQAFHLTVGGERLDLSRDDKASRRYARQVESMRAEISKGWEGETVNATAFLASVITVVAEAEEQLPDRAAYAPHREAWGALHSALARLYEIFDPEYEDEAGIHHGASVGERMVPV